MEEQTRVPIDQRRISKLNQSLQDARPPLERCPTKAHCYNIENVIGNGSFGVVYQALDETGAVVAIKKVLQDQRYKNRELQTMKEISHPNVTTLKHAYYSNGPKQDDVFLNLVMDYMPETLYSAQKAHFKMKKQMPLLVIKMYSYQLARSLAYINGLGLCHRDIKPQNLLVDQERHLLKLADFGSAKRLVSGEPNVSYICSRYYRAPELIFGSTDYDFAIDVWSMGCVIAEMLLGQTLFPGQSGVEQLVEIIKVLGTPTRDQLQAMNPNYTQFRFPVIKANPWNKLFSSRTPPEAIDLVSQLLVYPPEQRLRPMEVLLHPFFDEIRDECAPDGRPDFFDFSAEERAQCSQEMLDKLIPAWYTS